jgi:hypothetical protein
MIMATFTWTGASSDDYSLGANWTTSDSSNSVPQDGDTILLPAGSSGTPLAVVATPHSTRSPMTAPWSAS